MTMTIQEATKEFVAGSLKPEIWNELLLFKKKQGEDVEFCDQALEFYALYEQGDSTERQLRMAAGSLLPSP